MTNRRSFFKSLLGLFVSPAVAKVIPLPVVPTVGYKIADFTKTGIIYAPYIPLLVMSTYGPSNHPPSSINKDLYQEGSIQFYGNAPVAQLVDGNELKPHSVQVRILSGAPKTFSKEGLA